MRREGILLGVGLALLLVSGPARATEWVADFTDWSDMDLAAVSNYTDTDGQNPRTFTVTFSTTPRGTGWLTQGTRGGVPTTAKFLHPGVGESGAGRARFTSNFPESMLSTTGLSFAWKARYANYSIGRGPVQLIVRDAANNGHRPYFRVQNGVNLRILNNSGGNMTGIDNLVLPFNVSDPPIYHDWSVSVIAAYGEVSPGVVQDIAHWKVWLDGQQLFFTGTNGQHVYQDVVYSFFTIRDADITPSAAEFSLGEVNTQDRWDFDFDCVAYRDDLNNGEPLTCETEAEYCELTVLPLGNQTATTYRGLAATPASFSYQVVNLGSVAAGYAVAETDADGNAQDYTWLALDKAAVASIPAAGTDTVVASIVDTDLPGGTHTAYITYTETCDPPQRFTRRIDLIVTDCLSHVDQAAGVYRTIGEEDAGVEDVVFTVTNAGVKPIDYTVEKLDVCDWLTLDKLAGGTLANLGDSDQVTASIDETGLTPGLYTCQLKFTDTCAPAVEMVRSVYLSVRDANSPTHWYAGEFEFWEGQDRTAVSPLVTFPTDEAVMQFVVQNPTANPGDDPQGRGAPPGWITQGFIDDIATTAKFSYNWTNWARASLNSRDEAYNAHVPLRSDRYDAAKGLAWAWRQKLGNYSMMGTDIRRGPIQLVLPTVAGQEENGRYSATVPCRSAYINILTDTITGSGDPIREIRILNNDGNRYGNINAYVLPQSLVNEYHNWSASACFDTSFDSVNAYWNLWVDGKQLMFGGTDGSVMGPGGKTYSFRTSQNINSRPYLRYGEVGNSGTERFWDMEVDYIRMISLEATGAPYWDGLGWHPAPPPSPCGDMWGDRDVDGDVDMADFAVLQQCYAGTDKQVWPDGHPCLCFDRNRDGDIDEPDVAAFAACGTGPDVPYDLDDLPAGCVP